MEPMIWAASTSLKHFPDYKMHLQSLSHLTLTLGAPPPIPPDTLLSGNPWSGLGGKGRRGGAMLGSVGAQNTFHHFCRFLSPRHSVTHICFLSVAARLQQKVDGLHSLRIFCRVTPVPLSYKTNKHFIFQRCKWQRRRWWCCCLSSSWEVVTASVSFLQLYTTTTQSFFSLEGKPENKHKRTFFAPLSSPATLFVRISHYLSPPKREHFLWVLCFTPRGSIYANYYYSNLEE